MSIWKRRLIVAAAPLADNLVQALLTAGATAVICCDGKAEAADCPDAGCFTVLYESLFGEAATPSTAVEAASESPPLSTKHQEKQKKRLY